MARTKTDVLQPAQAPDFIEEKFDELTHSANELVVAKAQQDARARAVALRLGYQLPGENIDADLIQRDISANMRRSVEACFEVGKGLMVLKECCPHGQFMARLDVLGIEPRVAQRFMASAVKFSNAASTPLLKAIGNQTKLFEMLVLDDEQIEELELTGQTGELTLDDVATMSVRELRAALREERQDKQATTRLIAGKDAKINELTKKLVKFNVDADLPEAFEQAHAAVNESVNTILTHLNKLSDIRSQALNNMLQEDEHGKQVLEGLLENLGILMFGGYVAIEEKLAATKQSFDESLKQHTDLV